MSHNRVLVLTSAALQRMSSWTRTGRSNPRPS